jgi:hypothetical protein
MKRFQMFLPQRILDRLREQSIQTKLSMADIIRKAIDFYFLHIDKERK